MERVVEPEILDGLPPDDPEAVRSRRDLARINFLMGNERWIRRQVAIRPDLAAKGIVEWGAGSGHLISSLSAHGPTTGVDLVPRPLWLSEAVDWKQGDVFEQEVGGGVLIANLFLHHFEADSLRPLGTVAKQFEQLVFVEPLRTKGSLFLGHGVLPLVNRVTRHDMLVSIRAGFVPGELPELLGLDPEDWKVSERCSWRGGLRMLASRR